MFGRPCRANGSGASRPGAFVPRSVTLVADSLQQRRVALVAGRGPQEGGTLLSSLHFLRRAIEPHAELVEGGTEEVLRRSPDVVIVADASQVPITARDELADWVRGGGHLIRFAGPRLAAGDSLMGGSGGLLPVRLRPGSRALGGTMSWDSPKALERFPPGSPFDGLEIHDRITVDRQVLAQPGPDWRPDFEELEDGTPLVTVTIWVRADRPFHVPAMRNGRTCRFWAVPGDARAAGMSAGDLSEPPAPAGRRRCGFRNAHDAHGRRGSRTGRLPGNSSTGIRLGTAASGIYAQGQVIGRQRRRGHRVACGTVLAGGGRDCVVARSRSIDLKGWLLALAICILAVDGQPSDRRTDGLRGLIGRLAAVF